MYKTTLKINGMMCPMCEAHVNDALRKEFQDIKKIKSSHSKNETVLISENEYSKEQFAAVLDKTRSAERDQGLCPMDPAAFEKAGETF